MASKDATLREELTALTPRVRRYARALVSGSPASSALGDDIVHATLMRALGARHLGLATDLVIRLYATVTQLNRELVTAGQQARAAGAGQNLISVPPSFAPRPQTRLSTALLSLPLDQREALLLVGLEGFDYAESSRILRISRAVLIARLAQARAALERALQAHPSSMSARHRVPYLRLVT